MAEANYTKDLHHEYQAEMRKLLAERFLYFCLGVSAVTLFQAVTTGYSDVIQPLWRWFLQGDQRELAEQIRLPGREQWVNVGQTILDAIIYGSAAYLAWRGTLRGKPLDKLAADLLQISGAVGMVLYAVITRAPSNSLSSVFIAHLMACAFMPWTWRQALRPVVPLLVLNAILVTLFYGGWFDLKLIPQKLVSILLSPLIILPGVAVAFIKHFASVERFRTRFLEARYGQMSQELTAARAIHDALFPSTASTYGPLILDYRYTPKKEIGGDYLFARAVPRPQPDGIASQNPSDVLLHLVILDVTGHGISAALSVNRIHGELERLYGEQPTISPRQVMQALNRYIELTMSAHAIFVTGIVITIDPAADSITYSAGGHPPAFIRRQSGKVEQLATTGTVLGALLDADYHAGQETTSFYPGDSLIAYTDGAIEATDAAGEQFGVSGVAKALIAAPPMANLATYVSNVIDEFRIGPAGDDVLVIELRRKVKPLAEEHPPKLTFVSAA